MRRLLDRYVLREILAPLGLGFLVYTFILLTQFLFRSAEMIIRRGVPAADVGRLLLYTLPNIVVLTLPMALLFGILVAIGRLSSDGELVALRSCGVSLSALYRPILALSAGLTGVNLLLMLLLLPRGNHALQTLRLDIMTKSISRQVEPRVFYEEWEGLVVYVFEIPPGQSRWKGVFLAEDLPGADNQITVAEWGEVKLDASGERLLLELENAVTHKVNFGTPDRYETNHNVFLQRLLEDRFTTSQRARASAAKGLRELTLGELLERVRDPQTPAQSRNLARAEIHKKFSIPAACLVFGLIALPLGSASPRGGKSSSFAVSVAVILFYYVLLSNGEEAARVGKIAPWLAMWLPNLAFALLGGALVARRNRDRGSLVADLTRRAAERARRWLAALERRRAARRPVRAKARREPAERSRPPLRLRFPNLLDRYVIRLFGNVFGLVAVSAVAIYVIADLTEMFDEILNNEIPGSVVFSYYKYMSLQIFFNVAPILVLVTTLITFALLSRTNEVTAAKALGISLYRVSMPAVAAAVLVALLCGFLETFVLPASNSKVAQLHDRIRGREAARTYHRADRQWLYGQGRRIFNYLHYDAQAQALQRLQAFEFDERYRLSGRLFAARARWRGGRWELEEAWTRGFDRHRLTGYQPLAPGAPAAYSEAPGYFESELREPAQMSYGELRDYIEELKGQGQAVPELEVQLHNKVAFPVVSVVMALVALPYAFRLGRRGTLYGIGLAVVLGMVFLGLLAFFTTLGEIGALPALLAVWAPSVAFGMLSVYLFLGLRT